jgi:hypothetical protein
VTLIHWQHTDSLAPHCSATTRNSERRAAGSGKPDIAPQTASPDAEKPDNSGRAQPLPICYFGPVSAIVSDDLRLSWADAKSIEKMIVGSTQTTWPLTGKLTTHSHNHVIFSHTLRRHLPSLLRHGWLTRVSTENRAALLRPKNLNMRDDNEIRGAR